MGALPASIRAPRKRQIKRILQLDTFSQMHHSTHVVCAKPNVRVIIITGPNSGGAQFYSEYRVADGDESLKEQV